MSLKNKGGNHMKDLETIFKGYYKIPEIDRVDETKTRTTHALVWNPDKDNLRNNMNDLLDELFA